MSRTYRKTYPGTDYRPPWGKPGIGKYNKNQLARAHRRIANGTGKTRAIARWSSECNRKGT